MSSSILRDMAEIVWATAPELRVYGLGGPSEPSLLSKWLNTNAAKDYLLWREIWAGIKPVKFGNSITWSDAGSATLARYMVPRSTYCLVLRVETVVLNYEDTAVDFFVPAAPPGTYSWGYESLGATSAQVVTDAVSPQLLTGCEEFLVFKGGYYITLDATWTVAPPNDEPHEVRTLVYAYNVNSEIVDRIGSNQAIVGNF